MPTDSVDSIHALKHSSIQIEYHAEALSTEAQWIYYPDPQLSYHRILVRSNFCPDSRGYWTETNLERCEERTSTDTRFTMPYAYPLNTIDKPAIMDRLLGWCRERHVIGLGRWGEHQHYNSDVTVDLALQLADKL